MKKKRKASVERVIMVGKKFKLIVKTFNQMGIYVHGFYRKFA